jgi:hypothetical protein
MVLESHPIQARTIHSTHIKAMSLLWMFEFLDLRITSLGGGVHKSEMFGANTRTKVGTL